MVKRSGRANSHSDIYKFGTYLRQLTLIEQELSFNNLNKLVQLAPDYNVEKDGRMPLDKFIERLLEKLAQYDQAKVIAT